jgi:hypothetical protein
VLGTLTARQRRVLAGVLYRPAPVPGVSSAPVPGVSQEIVAGAAQPAAV